MKTFKQFILTVNEEVERYLFDPTPNFESGPPKRRPNPYMFQYDPNLGTSNWGFGYNNLHYGELPFWLRLLWGYYDVADLLPLLGGVMDAADIYQLLERLRLEYNMTDAEYQEMVRQLMFQIYQEHGADGLGGINPFALPGFLGKSWYARTSDGRYQLFRWNPVTQMFEPFGEPIDTPPSGNEYPVYNDEFDPYRIPLFTWGDNDYYIPGHPSIPGSTRNMTPWQGGQAPLPPPPPKFGDEFVSGA